MISVDELLQQLGQLGIRVKQEGDDLIIEAPEGAITEPLLAALKTHKRQILQLLRPASAAFLPPLQCAPANRNEAFPLTAIQEAYLVGRSESVHLGGVGCHYYQEFDRDGIEIDRLERSFQALIERHDMLRAKVTADGQQVIQDVVPIYRFAVLDLRGQDAELAARSVQKNRADMSHRRFAPDEWPLFEIRVTQFDEARVRIHLSFDLLMLDAESLALVIRDWGRLYDDPRALAALDVSFRDYVITMQQARGSGRYLDALAYWDARLDDLPPGPELPRSRVDSSGRGQPAPRARCRSMLSIDEAARLKMRASSGGLTMTAAIAAAFADVVALWSKDKQFTLNLTHCQRHPLHSRLEEVVGDFTSTILLQIDARQDRFRDRASLLQRTLLADLDHSIVSGIEVSRRQRARLGEPFVATTVPIVLTSLLGHAGGTSDVLFCNNWLGSPGFGATQTPQVSLDFLLYEDEGRLVSQWDYVPGEFPDGMMDAMFAIYSSWLARLAEEDAAWETAARPALPAAMALRRTAANATGEPLPDVALHAPFLDRVARDPGRPAVIGGGRVLSYTELERRSRQLAQKLVGLDAVPNHLIAVVMDKGWEQVVAALGILRAGAAYLPVDASLPEARLHELLAQGGVTVAVTQGAVDGRLNWPSDTRVVIVEEEICEESKDAAPLPDIEPDDLAYTIFTSGSTGRPKGVKISHRAALNTVLDINRRFAIGPGDRVLALSALGFDLSVYDIFGLLAAGGAVVLPDACLERSPEHWARLIERHRVSVWNSVPMLMKMLVESLPDETAPQLASMRLAMLSGDWIPVGLPDRIRVNMTGVNVVSLGGATETSIWSICYPVGSVPSTATSIPYGKPLTNFAAHVLDDQLQSRPDWAVGEICFSGAGLAQGYWRDPAETSRRFVTQPQSGLRVYRTGDLGRYLPDGNIEILGREDLQVKIGGHRIECGEVEHALTKHPSIREAIVRAWPDGNGDKRLVAYVVATDNADLSAWEAHLRALLPGYMVPSTFVPMERLPVSSNGKVDRARLKPPELPRRNGEATTGTDRPAAPLIEMVSEVLGGAAVRLDDRLRDLGCTSLHLVQIHRRLKNFTAQDFPVAEMFNHATLRSLAAWLGRSGDHARDEHEPTQTVLAHRTSRARRLRDDRPCT
jgi:pyochelin synthetase